MAWPRQAKANRNKFNQMECKKCINIWTTKCTWSSQQKHEPTRINVWAENSVNKTAVNMCEIRNAWNDIKWLIHIYNINKTQLKSTVDLCRHRRCWTGYNVTTTQLYIQFSDKSEQSRSSSSTQHRSESITSKAHWKR